MKLSKEICKEYQEAKDVLNKYSEQIEERIDEILRFLCERFGDLDTELETWWFPNAPEGEVGTLEADLSNDDDTIEFEWEGTGLLAVTKVWGYFNCFPVKYLFMENEEIAQYIQSKIDAEEEKKRRRKESALKKRQLKEQVKKSALSKLTEDERKVLGF